MDFTLTDDQRMLVDSADRWLAQEYDFPTRRAMTATAPGFSDALWQGIAEQGWLMLPFAEADGGLGGTAVDMALLMEAAGRGMLAAPLVETAVLGAVLAPHVIGSALVETWAGGTGRLALAWSEAGAQGNPLRIATLAQAGRITGHKTGVIWGAAARHLIVTAQSTDGVEVFLIPTEAPGVTMTAQPTLGGGFAAEVVLRDAPGDRLGGADLMDRLILAGALAVAAEGAGLMRMLTNRTVEYAKTRVQFGNPIASFQALQHRMVNMFAACEMARSAVFRSASLLDHASPEAARAIHAAKAFVGRHGRAVGKEAVQLHGAIGAMDEYPVGHGLARLVEISRTFGDTDWHLAQHADLSLGPVAA